MNQRQMLGRKGETLAALYLEARGFVIMSRNVRTGQGEIDLIAEKDGLMIFCEVKTRRTQSYGYPETSITARKQETMIACVEEYLQNRSEEPAEWRIDVLAVEISPDGKDTHIEWFENAVT